MHKYKLLKTKNGDSFMEIELLLFAINSVIGNLSVQSF